MGAPPPLKLCPLYLQAVDRRAALGLLAAAAAVSTAQPSEAAYGDAARVFAGKITNKSGASYRDDGAAGKVAQALDALPAAMIAPLLSLPPAPAQPALTRRCCWLAAPAAGFVPYAGEGFAVLIPSKWNPSKEQDFPGVVLRCVGPPARSHAAHMPHAGLGWRAHQGICCAAGFRYAMQGGARTNALECIDTEEAPALTLLFEGSQPVLQPWPHAAAALCPALLQL